MGHAVPNLMAQNRAPGNVREVPRNVCRDISLPPTEIELLQGEIAAMRTEAQERDERIEALEALLTENGIEVPS